jgi:hypothetical protein
MQKHGTAQFWWGKTHLPGVTIGGRFENYQQYFTKVVLNPDRTEQ